jgi:hypothetical protein
MKNIQAIKDKYQKEFSKEYCDLDNISLCEKDICHCRILSEVWAYIESVIPEEFRHLSIFDFSGDSKDHQRLVSSPIVIEAKNLICRYCWGSSWIDVKKKYKTESKIKEFFNHHSRMEERRKKGNNVIIFGESIQPIGRTLIASIIMKEAIKLRMKKGDRGQSYDWVDFSSLKDGIINDRDDIVDYRSCDWLVVDNIEYNEFATVKQKHFLNDIVTPFFIGRQSDNLPTILVFKFDIRKKTFNIGDFLGSGIEGIVNNRKTLRIPLCNIVS